jgi:glycosyltransferase involved in cell wall biosynthesis
MISVTILTKNSAETLAATLDSLKTFDDVLILDTGSTDATLEIAKKYPNVTVRTMQFLGFGATHNVASALASRDWILSVDSDEVLSPELVDELHALPLDPACVYSIARLNYLNGKQIKWCGGWHPDRVIRLYNKQKTAFDQSQVHEKVISKGLQEIQLHHPMHHTPYRQMADFLNKMQAYSTLFATQHAEKRSASLGKAILHSWFAFFKSYVLKRGFMGGKEGAIISFYNAHTAFYKYLKLDEANKK